MKRAVERSYRESAQKHATLVESINGLDMIKATSAEGQLQRNWDGYVARLVGVCGNLEALVDAWHQLRDAGHEPRHHRRHPVGRLSHL